MDVIGISILSDYGVKHAKAMRVLRALHALLAEADWTGRACVERDCGAIASFDSDHSLTLELAEAGCNVALSIHYGLGVVRIIAVTPLKH